MEYSNEVYFRVPLDFRKITSFNLCSSFSFMEECAKIETEYYEKVADETEESYTEESEKR